MKLIKSKAPLRLGLAGGGTDVSPYSDNFGGAVLNATINLYAHAVITPLENGRIELISKDLGEKNSYESAMELPIDKELTLLKGVYNRIVKDFTKQALSFRLMTYSDVPKGSGLGSSSTITVSIIGAFKEWLNLPLGDYDIARLAYDIEREDLQMAGGKQDQYAATFGGFNFMEFYEGARVLVNPLRIKRSIRNELESNLILYYTGTSRESGNIIKNQTKNFEDKNSKSVEAAHLLKEQAIQMKEAILRGKLGEIGTILNNGWEFKKKMASKISNPEIDKVYSAARNAGATGGKISGAGGGGFMILYCPGDKRFEVQAQLAKFSGSILRFNFSGDGLYTWKY